MTFWTIARNDLKQTVREKMFFVWMFFFPMLFIVIFGLAFQEDPAEDRKVSLNVLDLDHSLLSQAFIEELQGDKYTIEILKDETEKSYRTLVIPQNFSRQVLAGQKVEIVLERERESQREADQAAHALVLKAVIKTLTRVILSLPKDQEPSTLDGVFLENFRRLITVKAQRAGRLQSLPAGFNHSVPGTAVMFVIFTVLMYGGILLQQERRHGQLERTYLSPATFTTLIGGKWISRVAMGMIQILILFAAGKVIFKIYLGPSLPALFLISLFYCATIAGMSLFLGSVIQKEETLIIINIFAANIMAALGGCWWPLELAPPAMKTLSYAFPTGWAMDALNKLIFFGYNLDAVLVHILALTGFTLAFLFIAVRFFRLRKD